MKKSNITKSWLFCTMSKRLRDPRSMHSALGSFPVRKQLWHEVVRSSPPIAKVECNYMPSWHGQGLPTYLAEKRDVSSSSSVICQTTGPKPLPKRFLHIVRSRASFIWQYPLLSLRSSSSFLRLLVTSICPFIFPSIWYLCYIYIYHHHHHHHQ